MSGFNFSISKWILNIREHNAHLESLILFCMHRSILCTFTAKNLYIEDKWFFYEPAPTIAD